MIASLLSLFFVGMLPADDPAKNEAIAEERAAKVREATNAAIKELAEKIKGDKRRVAKSKDRDAARSRIAADEKLLAAYKSGDSFAYPYLAFPLATGSFGQHGKANVLQIIGKDTALVRIFLSETVYRASQPAGGGRATVSVDSKTRECLLMVKGVPTAGFVDGGGMDLPPIDVTGTTTYSTALGGTKTVFVAKPLDTARIEAILKSGARKN